MHATIKVNMLQSRHTALRGVIGTVVTDMCTGSTHDVTPEQQYIIDSCRTVSKEFVEKVFEVPGIEDAFNNTISVWPKQGVRATVFEARLLPIEHGEFHFHFATKRWCGNSLLIPYHGWGDVAIYLDGELVDIVNGIEFFSIYKVVDNL